MVGSVVCPSEARRLLCGKKKEEEAPGRANEKLIVHMHCNVNYCLLVACVAETKKKGTFGGLASSLILLPWVVAQRPSCCASCLLASLAARRPVELVEFDAGVQ